MYHYGESTQNYVSGSWTDMLLFVSFVVLLTQVQAAPSTSISASSSSDLSRPTYGFQGPTSSSVGYNPQAGLQMKGQLGDILGPPLKVANGVGNILTGSALSGLGNSMNANSAILGVDANLLEAVGKANMLKGGVNYAGAMGRTAAHTALKGLKGKKLSSIVEFPIKVVALKDLKEGKILHTLANTKQSAADGSRDKTQTLLQKGEYLKNNGIHQVISGATEGLTNIGNVVQTTTNNAASALRFLPIIMNLPDPSEQVVQQPEQMVQRSEETVQQPEQQLTSESQNRVSYPTNTNNGLKSGPLFGGLNSFLPSSNGIQGPYAAVFNIDSPFHSLFTNPAINPLFRPLGNTMTMKSPQQQHQPQQLKLNPLESLNQLNQLNPLNPLSPLIPLSQLNPLQNLQQMQNKSKQQPIQQLQQLKQQPMQKLQQLKQQPSQKLQQPQSPQKQEVEQKQQPAPVIDTPAAIIRGDTEQIAQQTTV